MIRVIYKASSEPSDTMRFAKSFNSKTEADEFANKMKEQKRFCFTEEGK